MQLVDGAKRARLDDADILLDYVDHLVIGSFPGVFDPAEQRW
jgi:hypothetical protein